MSSTEKEITTNGNAEKEWRGKLGKGDFLLMFDKGPAKEFRAEESIVE